MLSLLGGDLRRRRRGPTPTVTSNYGIDWVSANPPEQGYGGGNDYYAVGANNDGYFIAIPYHEGSNSGSDSAYVSNNNTGSWTEVPIPVNHYNSVNYFKNNTWVAGSDFGNTSKFAYSTNNGSTWTEGTAANSTCMTGQVLSACVGDYMVSVGGYGAAGSASYSSDGINWTLATGMAGSAWKDIASGNGKIVAVGWGNNAAYSTNGTSWTQTSLSVSDGYYWSTVAFGQNKFVAFVGNPGIGNFPGYSVYSNDGITWANATGIPDEQITRVRYNEFNDIWIAVGFRKTWSSTDGINWTLRSDFGFYTMAGLALNDTKIYALANTVGGGTRMSPP